ncbi:MAG: hypothetical protein RR214_03860 [Synergistaceae bacterium]
MECKLSSEGRKIMDIKIPKAGVVSRETRKFVVYTQQNNQIVKFPVYNESVIETAVCPKEAGLKVYPGHPMADDWLKLKPSEKPILTMYCNGRMAAMQKGTVMEEIVSSTTARTEDTPLHMAPRSFSWKIRTETALP